jgi:hypothetical protein
VWSWAMLKPAVLEKLMRFKLRMRPAPILQ